MFFHRVYLFFMCFHWDYFSFIIIFSSFSLFLSLSLFPFSFLHGLLHSSLLRILSLLLDSSSGDVGARHAKKKKDDGGKGKFVPTERTRQCSKVAPRVVLAARLLAIPSLRHLAVTTMKKSSSWPTLLKLKMMMSMLLMKKMKLIRSLIP